MVSREVVDLGDFQKYENTPEEKKPCDSLRADPLGGLGGFLPFFGFVVVVVDSGGAAVVVELVDVDVVVDVLDVVEVVVTLDEVVEARVDVVVVIG